MPTCAGLLELRGSRPRLLKSAFDAKNSMYAGCLGLSPAILLQFTVEMCAAANNWKKIH